MSGKTTHSVDVKTLAERLFSEGSLGPAASPGDAAGEGGKIHRRMQGRGIPGYRPEVALSRSFPGELVDLVVAGRADGIFERDGLTHIEEIKTVSRSLESLEPDPLHLAQLRIYGWIACLEEGRREIALDLVYVNRPSGETRPFSWMETAEGLDGLCGPPLFSYLAALDAQEARRRGLRSELAALDFPFSDFRPGQREAAEGVFRAIRDGRILFLQAPTGLGKTMAVLYPALKALGLGHGAKVFYLTAKNSGAAAAEKALLSLKTALPSLRWISLSAKGKICFLAEGAYGADGERFRPPCDPAICPYAADYFSKARASLPEDLRRSAFTRQTLEELARARELCPFEYSLDLSLDCDIIIADYNYAFDPGSRLKRFFARGRTDFVLLVDEAHNLVDRARSMFSAKLSKRRVLDARRSSQAMEKKALSGLNAALLAARKGLEPGEAAMKRVPRGVGEELGKCLDRLDALIGSGASLSPPVYDLYWELRRAAAVLELYDESCLTLASSGPGEFALDFLCVDPSTRLGDILRDQRATVFFSGSLSPPAYFGQLLAGGAESEFIDLPSPFPPGNCAYAALDSVSVKWKDREANLDAYARAVSWAFCAVRGNQIVFSPSFAFQQALLERLAGPDGPPPGWAVQDSGMEESDREAFMAAFEREGTRGFAVCGGSFSESVDLVGERLVGAIVFGVGLPQINARNEAIRGFFEAKRGNGYAWAYLYPGLNKVLQAAGRVIRSESDRGFVLLVDERYGSAEYRRLLPERWDLKRLRRPEELAGFLPEGLLEPSASLDIRTDER